MQESVDRRLAKIFLIPAVAIVGYWIIVGLFKLYKWLTGLPSYSSAWWSSIGHFCLDNLSIIIVVYLIVCLQASGIAEFKYQKNFLKAFVLAVFLTPPIMMATWGRRKGRTE